MKPIATISGVAGVLLAASVAFSPAAQAEPFPAGVECSGTTCRNDTDHHYLVESWQHCRVTGTFYETAMIPFNVMLDPHETVEVTGAQCRPLIHDDDEEDSVRTVTPTEPSGITYSRAVIYDPNARRAPSGSAG